MIALAGGAAGLLAAAGLLSLAAGALGVPLTLEWPTTVGSLVAAGAERRRSPAGIRRDAPRRSTSSTP